MLNSKIMNVIFYYGERTDKKNAIVFYDDGRIILTDYDGGVRACVAYYRYLDYSNKAKTRVEIQKDLFTNNTIRVVSKQELFERYSKVIPQGFLKTIKNGQDNPEKHKIEDGDYPKFIEANMPDKTKNMESIRQEIKLVEDIETKKTEVDTKPSGYADEYADVIVDSPIPRPKSNKRKAINVLAFIMAFEMVLGLYGCDKTNLNNTTTSISSEANQDDENLIYGDNSYYDNYSFANLLKVTTQEKQKNSMISISSFLHHFNKVFAEGYLEPKKDIRAALSFDEGVAIQNAYNDYSKNDIKAIFNGADINASKMSRNYKDASLQLMGAYIIETKNHPLELSNLIESEEGKEFYKKYHDLFIEAKYATGDKQKQLVKEFFTNVRKDFPVTKEKRTEGISHSENYDSIESYKLAVTPIIAAAEMIFRNLDLSLDDMEIDFINDIGLCNYADEKFKRIETIVLSAEEDKTNPLYDQYRNAIIKMLKDNKEYVIDDAHRELSNLETFQLIVNGRFDEVLTGNFISTTTYATESYTTYSEKTTREEKEIPDSVKKEIDNEIAAENERAKQSGEQKAEQNRQSMQAAEDKKADKVKQEVQDDEKDMNDKVNQANNGGGTVNESDFGDHGVDFDDNHSDENGNLDDSVDNITTDPKGDQSDEPLPDPNVTGAEFDNKALAPVGSNYETLVDEYINSLSQQSEETATEEKGYQYIK